MSRRNVSLIGLKVLKRRRGGSTSDVLAAVEFAALNKQALGIDVIAISLGHPPYESATTDPLVAAVEQASAAGILVVTSAGNYGVNPATGLPGYGGISVAGNAPSALTVGRPRTEGTRSAATTPSPRSARVARRGSTATRSRTLLRRGTA